MKKNYWKGSRELEIKLEGNLWRDCETSEKMWEIIWDLYLKENKWIMGAVVEICKLWYTFVGNIVKSLKENQRISLGEISKIYIRYERRFKSKVTLFTKPVKQR